MSRGDLTRILSHLGSKEQSYAHKKSTWIKRIAAAHLNRLPINYSLAAIANASNGKCMILHTFASRNISKLLVNMLLTKKTAQPTIWLFVKSAFYNLFSEADSTRDAKIWGAVKLANGEAPWIVYYVHELGRQFEPSIEQESLSVKDMFWPLQAAERSELFKLITIFNIT